MEGSWAGISINLRPWAIISIKFRRNLHKAYNVATEFAGGTRTLVRPVSPTAATPEGHMNKDHTDATKLIVQHSTSIKEMKFLPRSSYQSLVHSRPLRWMRRGWRRRRRVWGHLERSEG
ncbi:hypothetical protein ACQJBY_030051 [Aegilops geniculata]